MSSLLFKSNDEIIVSCGPDGFCSRVDMLFILPYALEKFPNMKVRVFWPVNRFCDIKYEDLFSVPSNIKPINEGIDSYSKNNPLDLNVLKFLKLKSDMKTSASTDIRQEGEFTLWHRQHVYHKLMAGNSSKKREYIKSLKFSRQVSDAADNFIKLHNINKDVIGIHIRSLETPKWHSRAKKGEVSGKDRLDRLIDYYKKQMQKNINLNKNQKFLIRSDDSNIVKILYNQFPDNVIDAKDSYPNHTVDESNNNFPERIIARNKDSVFAAVAYGLLPLSITNYNDKIKVDMNYGYFSSFPILLSDIKKPSGNDPIFKTLYKIENQ